MAYPPEIKAAAKKKFMEGWSGREIAEEMDLSPDTVWRWERSGKWGDKKKGLHLSREQIEKQIAALSGAKNMTESKARKLSMLSKALARLERVDGKREKASLEKPSVKIEYVGDFRDKILGYPLRSYQRRWIEDPARFRTMLKGRQIGISWTMALDMVANGILRDVDQNLISTSIFQAKNTIRYAREHMKKLGIADIGTGSSTMIQLPNGRYIRVLPSGWDTNQGFPGDIWLDEFAWYRNPKLTWDAVVPSVTAVKGRVSVVSTPYEAGPHNFFWVISTNDGGEFPNFSRHEVTIEQAAKEGLDMDLAELRSLFDSDTWDRLYMCRFFSDEDSFFTLAELNECRGVCLDQWVGNDRRAGWDMAKTTDASEVVGVEKLENQVFVRGIKTWRRLKYHLQRDQLIAALKRWKIKEIHIDETGVGQGVKDFVEPSISEAGVEQYWHTFTQPFKAILAGNMKKIVEEERLVIPGDDQVLISQFLSIKRRATQTGISYDSARNAAGHGDRFWALALACNGLDFGNSEISVEVW